MPIMSPDGNVHSAAPTQIVQLVNLLSPPKKKHDHEPISSSVLESFTLPVLDRQQCLSSVSRARSLQLQPKLHVLRGVSADSSIMLACAESMLLNDFQTLLCWRVERWVHLTVWCFLSWPSLHRSLVIGRGSAKWATAARTICMLVSGGNGYILLASFEVETLILFPGRTSWRRVVCCDIK